MFNQTRITEFFCHIRKRNIIFIFNVYYGNFNILNKNQRFLLCHIITNIIVIHSVCKCANVQDKRRTGAVTDLDYRPRMFARP